MVEEQEEMSFFQSKWRYQFRHRTSGNTMWSLVAGPRNPRFVNLPWFILPSTDKSPIRIPGWFIFPVGPTACEIALEMKNPAHAVLRRSVTPRSYFKAQLWSKFNRPIFEQPIFRTISCVAAGIANNVKTSPNSYWYWFLCSIWLPSSEMVTRRFITDDLVTQP